MNFLTVLIYFWPRFRICFRTCQIKRQVSIIMIRIIFTPSGFKFRWSPFRNSGNFGHASFDRSCVMWAFCDVGFCYVGFYHLGFCPVGFCHVGFCHVGFWHVGFCQNWEIEVDVTYRTCCIFYIDPSGFTFLKITNFCKKFTLELIKILDPFKYPIGSDFVYFQSSWLYFQISYLR